MRTTSEGKEQASDLTVTFLEFRCFSLQDRAVLSCHFLLRSGLSLRDLATFLPGSREVTHMQYSWFGLWQLFGKLPEVGSWFLSSSGNDYVTAPSASRQATVCEMTICFLYLLIQGICCGACFFFFWLLGGYCSLILRHLPSSVLGLVPVS